MKKANAIDVFIGQRRLAQIWFVLFLAVIGLWVWDRQRLIESLTRDTKFFVIDSAGTWYLPASYDLENATEVHDSQTRLAMQAIFDRNPGGYDSDKTVKALLSRSAFEKLQDRIKEDHKLAALQKIHQKVEVGDVKVLQTTREAVLTTCTAQVIQNGIFEGKSFTRVYQVKARFKFALNRNMKENGRFPTVVMDFDYVMDQVAEA
jgi:hypothetical protein